MSSDPPQRDDKSPTIGLVMYEGSPGRVPSGSQDGAYEFLRAEDQPDGVERVRPRRRWLSQGPETRLDYIDGARRLAAVEAASRASSSGMAALTSEAGLSAPLGRERPSLELADLTRATKAFDRYMDTVRRSANAAQGAAETARSGTQDAVFRGFGYAQQNINAAFDLAQKLVRAKNVQEAMELQAEFVRGQLAAMQDQAQELVGFVRSAPPQEAQRIRSAMRPVAEDARVTMERLRDAATDPA